MKTFSPRVHQTLQAGVDTCYLTSDVFFTMILFAPGAKIIEEKAQIPRGTLVDFYDGIYDFSDVVLATEMEKGSDKNLVEHVLLVASITLAMQGRDMGRLLARNMATQAVVDGRMRKKQVRAVSSNAYQWAFVRSHERIRTLRRGALRLLGWYRHLDPTGDTEAGQKQFDDRIAEYWRTFDSTQHSPARIDRAALRRATKLAHSLLGEETTTNFLRGSPVLVHGNNYSFQVSLGNIRRNGHGGVELNLCDREGQKLADICAYFDGMVALDQLISVYLYAQHGMEVDLIRASNIETVTRLGYRDDFLRKMIRHKYHTGTAVPPVILHHLQDQSVRELAEKNTAAVTEKVFAHLCANRFGFSRSLLGLVKEADQ